MCLQAWLMKNNMWSFAVYSGNGRITLYTEIRNFPLVDVDLTGLVTEIRVPLQVK